MSIILRSEFAYAGTVATIGYQNVTDKLITGVYLLKPFYKESSELVQSALKAQSGGNFSFLNKYINLNIGADVKFSDKVDFGATAGIDHLIRKQNKDKSIWVFDPGLFCIRRNAKLSAQLLQKNKFRVSSIPWQQSNDHGRGEPVFHIYLALRGNHAGGVCKKQMDVRCHTLVYPAAKSDYRG